MRVGPAWARGHFLVRITYVYLYMVYLFRYGEVLT